MKSDSKVDLKTGLKYDLHIHTKYSMCGNLEPSLVLKLAKKRGLNGIAITDHNEMKGCFKTKKLNKDKDFEVVVGSEVRTDKGDLLAYYINEPIKSRELFDVLDEIKGQGGLAVVAHPLRHLPATKEKNSCFAKQDNPLR